MLVHVIFFLLQVTMASMSVGEQYYKNLKEGTLHRMTPVVKYSRPYNFLKESDRESLIHTLVDMKALLDTLRWLMYSVCLNDRDWVVIRTVCDELSA